MTQLWENMRYLLPRIRLILGEREEDSIFKWGKDEVLMRFLEQWDGDVDKAASKYLETLEWRKTCLPIQNKKLKKIYKTGMLVCYGNDKDGRPVFYFREALQDPQLYSPRDIVDMLIMETEKRMGITDEVAVVIDRTGCMYRQTNIEFIKLFYYTYKTYYPCSLMSIIIYPCNFIVRGIWVIAKHFIGPKSERKTHFLSKREELLDYIQQDQLPEFL